MVANTLGEGIAPEIAGAQGQGVPVFTDGRKTAGSNKLGLHVAIIWHNTSGIFLFFFFLFLNIRQLANT
jgi:hypothetical protein